MKSYLINNLEDSNYDTIITLLDYEIQISRCLKSIKIPTNKTKRILVDTISCSLRNPYRFIEVVLNEDGTISLDDYNYVFPDLGTLKQANEILKSQSILKKTMLPESQIKEIKEN